MLNHKLSIAHALASVNIIWQWLDGKPRSDWAVDCSTPKKLFDFCCAPPALRGGKLYKQAKEKLFLDPSSFKIKKELIKASIRARRRGERAPAHQKLVWAMSVYENSFYFCLRKKARKSKTRWTSCTFISLQNCGLGAPNKSRKRLIRMIQQALSKMTKIGLVAEFEILNNRQFRYVLRK